MSEENKREYEKSQITLNLNAFELPDKVIGPKAWANQILALIVMRKGTFPSDPDRGIEISRYDFAFISNFSESIKRDIERQVAKYYPDIPLENIEIHDYTESKNTYAIIVLTFRYRNTRINAISAISSHNNIIDFKITI